MTHFSKIQPVDVARYYLRSELGHILPGLSRQIAQSSDIDAMDDQDVFGLCEALSVFYRLNAVWWIVGDPRYKWYEAEIRVEDIQLTGMGDTEISKLIDSNDIQKDPVKLRAFLNKYYADLGSGEDRYLVRPSKKLIELDTVLLIEEEDKLKLLDGSHRFIEQLLAGKSTVSAFIARATLPGAGMRPVIGGGVYRDLTNVLSHEEEYERTVIRETANLLTKYAGRDKNPLQQFPALSRPDK